MTSPVTLFLVDDNASLRTALRRLLETIGCTVVECPDGVSALSRLTTEKPSLIILDVQMPRLDGWKTLEELRKRGFSGPVLMLTEINDVPSRIQGLESGADDYVGKASEPTEILARVKALLRRIPRAAAKPTSLTQLRFGELLVDLTEKSANRGDRAVKLTRTEFAILDILARRSGRPLSRDQLVSAVWGISETPNTHALDTHLWRLRKKLGDAGEKPRWLRNLSGLGYVLDWDEPD